VRPDILAGGCPSTLGTESGSQCGGGGRVPWLARHDVPMREEMREGLAGVARSASLARLIFVLLHNAGVMVCVLRCVLRCVL